MYLFFYGIIDYNVCRKINIIIFTIGEGQFPLSAILTLPKGEEQPPVAILVPGSGNHDVNETVGANKPFQDIAWGLADIF